MTIKYATLTAVRNEEKNISVTIRGILNQSIKPKYIMVVDDGSTDNTASVLKNIKSDLMNMANIDIFQFDIFDPVPITRPVLFTKTRKDRGFSGLGTPAMAIVYNSGVHVLNQFSDWDYLVIVPADMILSNSYVESIIKKMIPDHGIGGGIGASKDEFRSSYNLDHVVGGGRIIKREILDYMHGFAKNFNWESSVLHCADFLGTKVERFDDIVFHRIRAGGKGHFISYIGWGRGMKDANYHPLVAMGRVVKEIILKHHFSKGIRLLIGYFAEPSTNYPDYSIYLRENQKKRIISSIRKILTKLRLY